MVSAKLAALTALLPLAAALEPRAPDAGAGFLRFPVTGRTGANPVGKHSKRQEDVSIVDRQSGTLYTIDVTLGTPGQTVPVHFDTGAPELWVNPQCENGSDREFCEAQERFTESSTLDDLDTPGQLVYGSGYANIQYVSDFVTIGEAKISQQIFGVAVESSYINVGILGAAPSLNGWENDYPSIFDNLAEQGLIGSRAFGMDLRGFHTDSGAVIFGGLDTKKFTGPLKKLPVMAPSDAPEPATRWWVSLDGITVDNGDDDPITVFDAEDGDGQVVLVDSGYTLSALPPKIFSELLAAFPDAKASSDGLYEVDCKDQGEGGVVNFRFGDLTVEVPYYEFVWKSPIDENVCLLGAFEDELPVLGDTFLRAAYVVYDFDQQTVHIAQSADCGSNIVPINDGVTVTEGDCGNNSTSSNTATTPGGSSSSGSAAETSLEANEPTGLGLLDIVAGAAEATESFDSGLAAPAEAGIAEPSGSEGATYSESGAESAAPAETETCTDGASATDAADPVTEPAEAITKTTTQTTSFCPTTTATYTVPHTVTCRPDIPNCPEGETKVWTDTITLRPGHTRTAPVVVPGCTESAKTTGGDEATAAPVSSVEEAHPEVTEPVTTLATSQGIGGNGTATAAPGPSVPVEAGAGRAVAPGLVAAVAGLLALAI